MSDWSSYLFQYGIGSAVFFLTLWLGTRRDADGVIWHDGRWRRGTLIGGLALYAVAHAVWIVLAVRG
jgi:hypothetical protein